MKKLMTLLLCLLVITGCTKNDKPEEKKDTTNPVDEIAEIKDIYKKSIGDVSEVEVSIDEVDGTKSLEVIVTITDSELSKKIIDNTENGQNRDEIMDLLFNLDMLENGVTDQFSIGKSTIKIKSPEESDKFIHVSVSGEIIESSLKI